MTIEAYLAWAADATSGRYELHDGRVIEMPAERLVHSEVKSNIYAAFRSATRGCKVECYAHSDGVAVSISPRSVYEPDALVYLGPKLKPNALVVHNPCIVVEVISPSSVTDDKTRKLIGYFNNPAVRHYLVVEIDEKAVLHHRRDDAGVITTRIVTEGAIRLDPPGLTITIDQIFEDT